MVHGFTQSGRAWGKAGDILAGRFELHAVDAPGHGRSAEVRAGLADGADLMVEAVGRPASWLGYSMGGRYALHAALRHPEAVQRLVVISATAGIDDPAAREERRRSDSALAARAVAEGLEPFVRWWVAQPLFASLPAGASALEGRLGGTAEGLASSLRLAGTGTQEPLWSALESLDMPVLVLAGTLDRKYCELASRLASGIGANASLRLVEGAGHACHLEKPEEVAEMVTSWLDHG